MHFTAQLNELNTRLDAVLLQSWWWHFGRKTRDKVFTFEAGGENWKLVSDPKKARLFREGKEVSGCSGPSFEKVCEGSWFGGAELDWETVHVCLEKQRGLFVKQDLARLKSQIAGDKWLSGAPRSYQGTLKQNMDVLMETPRFKEGVLKFQVVSLTTVRNFNPDGDQFIDFNAYGIYRISFSGIVPGARKNDAEPTVGVRPPEVMVPEPRVVEAKGEKKKKIEPLPPPAKAPRNTAYRECNYPLGVEHSIYMSINTWTTEELKYLWGVADYAYAYLGGERLGKLPGTNVGVAAKFAEIFKIFQDDEKAAAMSGMFKLSLRFYCSLYFTQWLYAIASGCSWQNDQEICTLIDKYNKHIYKEEYLDIYNILHDMGVTR